MSSQTPLKLRITGVDCPSCISKIETAMGRLEGVSDARMNLSSKTLEVDTQGQGVELKQVIKAVKTLGYGAEAFDEEAKSLSLEDPAWYQTAKGRLVIVSTVLVASAFVGGLIWPEEASYGFLIAGVLSLYPVARKAVGAARAGQYFTIESLMSLAVIGAFAIGENAEAALVVLLFAIGEVLEGVASGRARRSIRAMMDLLPRTAIKVTESGREEVGVESLEPGDLVEVRPGDRVSADGLLRSAHASLDESPVTGESIPVEKRQGEEVFAGTINATGVIQVEVTRGASDNTLARIVRLVEEAESSKAPLARFIDRFARIYAPFVVLVAVLTATIPPLFFGGAWLAWIYKALALLLIGCPCALVLSTPAAITTAISAGARKGLLIKGGVVLETLARVKRIAFDKTGTLTRGQPQVTDLVVIEGRKDEMLSTALAVESGSNHPLAKAIVKRAESAGLVAAAVTSAQALPGAGMEARQGEDLLRVTSPRYLLEAGQLPEAAEAEAEILERDGKTVVVVSRNQTILGLLALRDEPRADARWAISRLTSLGISLVILTGDNARTAKAVAGNLGLDARAELLPEDKLSAIEGYRAEGSLAMVGDGINDAPALARADVGIAMGGGTDVALETADAALLHDQAGDVVDLVRLSRATMANIRQNIIVALSLKAFFLVATLLGYTDLWMAVLADTGATVLVTLNALRLMNFRPDTRDE